MREEENMEEVKIGCLGWLMYAVGSGVISGLSVDYILSWFSKDIPFIADMIIGIFVSAISMPVAIVGWILRLFGVF